MKTRKQLLEEIAKFDMEKGIGILINKTGEEWIRSTRELYADLETADLEKKLEDRISGK
jgi:hypothetical protein